MILSPVATTDFTARATPVAIRLIGVLDRVLVESFSDACAGLVAGGRQRIIVALRDLVPLRDDSLNRFLATLDAYRSAGHEIRVDAGPSWKKLLRDAGRHFTMRDDADSRDSRRQIIIAHSVENRAGAV